MNAAKAADEPVPTTTVPAPDPAPDPAPAPTPKPKPKPKPASSRRQPVRQPTTTATHTQAPVVSSAPAVQSHPTKPAGKKRAVHKKAQTKPKTPTKPKPAAPSPKVVTPKGGRSGVLGTQTAATLDTGGSFGFSQLLIVALLSIAVACFVVASIPAMYVPWRPAAYFIAYRHLDIAIAGLALLCLAGCLVFLVGV